MNKLITVLGVAAVATLAGCKDPNYKHMNSQDDVKTVTAPQPGCKCPAGTTHTTPCACGAIDCACVVVAPVVTPQPPVVKSVEPTEAPVVTPPPAPVTPAEPETTVYYVQNGDTLSKISKKFNIKIDAIKKVNNLKSDVIRVGQKIKLPGKVEVGEQKVPVVKPVSKEVTRKGYESYKGPTTDYVVKSGDNLGVIAFSHGCNIRQLKELNSLTSDIVKVGQKLKVPANGKAAVAPAQKKEEKFEEKAADKAPVVETKEEAEVIADDNIEESAVEAASDTMTYVVQEGDDITGLSIRFCISPSVIRDLNNLDDNAKLEPGQQIKLPADAQQ